MPVAVAPARPKLTQQEAVKLLSQFDLSKYPVKLLGVRGYYKKTMGNPLKNDTGIYDDAIFIVSPDGFASFNANTDPSVNRIGMATLKAPQVVLYKIGLHGVSRPNPYEALRQHGRVTVVREGRGQDTDTAASPFYIDIHKGSYNGTSSKGCQTIYPAQWDAFLHLVKDQLKRYAQVVVPYGIVEV